MSAIIESAIPMEGVKGDSHQIWRTKRAQVNVASLRLFLRSSTGDGNWDAISIDSNPLLIDGNWDAISIDSNPLLRRPSKLIASRFPTPRASRRPEVGCHRGKLRLRDNQR
jgi:hypothetical protein